MSCVSGKRGFHTEALALEALVQNHIRFHHGPGQGPVNVYQCDDCGDWHFTSKGSIAAILKDPDILKRISREREAESWERKFRR